MAPPENPDRTAVAARLTTPPDAQGFPDRRSWDGARPVRFDADWRGENGDPQRETEVRLLWTPEYLFLRFAARYRSITVFPDSAPNGRRDRLWERDVAEAFLQPPLGELRRYREFEVAPNGMWIDLDIGPGQLHHLESGMRRRVRLLEPEKTWIAELAIPIKSITANFEPAKEWRVNFYRVEGPGEPRFYSAWQPTGTPQPNFHVPEKFGRLLFEESRGSR